MDNSCSKLMQDWKPVKGMSVYIVPDDTRYEPASGVIESIGRKYFTLGDAHNFMGMKFDLVTKNHNEPPYATCYQSKERYEEGLKLYDKIQDIKEKLIYLTSDQINTVFNWITEKQKK